MLICCVENAIVIEEDSHETEPEEDADVDVSDANGANY